MRKSSVFFVLSVVFCYSISAIDAANILYLEGIPSPSHHVWHKVLTYGLANKGHNVTVISVDVEKHNLTNLHYIKIEGVYEALFEMEEYNELLSLSEKSFYDEFIGAYEFFYLSCEMNYKSKGFKHLMNYPSDFKFDLVIYDNIMGPCLLAAADKFNYPPIVAATAYFGYEYAIDLVSDAIVFPFLPHIMMKNYDPKCFWSRFDNFFHYTFDIGYKSLFFNKRINKMVSKEYGKEIDLYGIEPKVQLALINSDKSLDSAQPMASNAIPVGGLQIQNPKPLPKNLEEIFKRAKKGVILFSLGTNVQPKLLGDHIINEFIEAFKSFGDYEILWKATGVDTTSLPKNLHILPWLPQNDILANPKTKLFITHSGLLSTQEAIKHGVPMIGMPVFVDQFANADKSVAKGTAETLLFKDFNAEVLRSLMQKVLSEPKYKENALIYSNIFLDQKEPPLERAIWWIEWVLRHPHSKVFDHPGKSMSMFQRLSLDVYLFIFIATLIVFKITLIAMCKITKLVCKSSNQTKKMKKN